MEKILILANSDIGLYLFRRELITELLKENELHIALPNGEYVQELKNMGCQFHATPIERRGMNPLSDFGLLLNYLGLIGRVKPNLIVTYTIKPNIYGGMAARIKGVPYAVNVTGLGTAFEKGIILRRFVSFLYKLALYKAKVVFFENQLNRTVFVKERIVRKSQQCVLKGAGVNLDFYPLLPYPKEKSNFRFLFMGRVMQEKGIDELLLALDRLRREQYSCVLDIVGGMEEDYREKIQKYEEKGVVEYHGFQTDVKPFIERCHCAVLPSWHEGMSNTNLECAASGRPIITSDIFGCKEAVIEGKTGYLSEVRNIDSLYKCLKKMLELSSRERESMGVAGRELMEKDFDRKKVVEKTIRRVMESF